MEVFEDEVIPFVSINVDTTQRVIYSTRSIFFEWIEERLEPGDDDKYYHIIHKSYKGYKCRLGAKWEQDPSENEGDYRVLTFEIYEDFTIRVDGERRIGSVVDKLTRYYRITDQGEICEVKN